MCTVSLQCCGGLYIQGGVVSPMCSNCLFRCGAVYSPQCGESSSSFGGGASTRIIHSIFRGVGVVNVFLGMNCQFSQV